MNRPRKKSTRRCFKCGKTYFRCLYLRFWVLVWRAGKPDWELVETKICTRSSCAPQNKIQAMLNNNPFAMRPPRNMVRQIQMKSLPQPFQRRYA